MGSMDESNAMTMQAYRHAPICRDKDRDIDRTSTERDSFNYSCVRFLNGTIRAITRRSYMSFSSDNVTLPDPECSLLFIDALIIIYA